MDKYGALQILNSESTFVRYKICKYIEQLEKENEKLRNFIIDKFGDSDISLTKVFGDIISAKTINEWLISNGYCIRMRHPNGICYNAVPTQKIPADYFKIVERKYGPRENKGAHTELETRFNVKGMLFILDLLKKQNMI
jgi:phage antirepressor YoqD-like protein